MSINHGFTDVCNPSSPLPRINEVLLYIYISIFVDNLIDSFHLIVMVQKTCEHLKINDIYLDNTYV